MSYPITCLSPFNNKGNLEQEICILGKFITAYSEKNFIHFENKEVHKIICGF